MTHSMTVPILKLYMLAKRVLTGLDDPDELVAQLQSDG